MSETIMEFVPHSRQNSIFPKLILSKTGDLYKIWGKVISFLCWSLSQPHFIPVQKRIIKQKAWMWGLDHRVMQSQGLIQSSFENLQLRWRFHSLSGQHGPVLGYPCSELFFPNIYLDFLCCNLCPLPLVTPFSFPPLMKNKNKKNLSLGRKDKLPAFWWHYLQLGTAGVNAAWPENFSS